MSMELVNGVLCLNCSDVERAKKAGLGGSAQTPDPLHPSTQISNRGDTSSARGDASSAGGLSSAGGPSFSGDISSSSGAPGAASGDPGSSGAVTPASAPVLGVNQPLSSGDRGTQLNLLL